MCALLFSIWQDVDLYGPRAWLKFINLSTEHSAVPSLTKCISLHDVGAIGDTLIQMASMNANIIIIGYPNLDQLKVFELNILKMIYNFNFRRPSVSNLETLENDTDDDTVEGSDDAEENEEENRHDFNEILSEWLNGLISSHSS
ncbi:uncharacterized protein MELLADRAFT_60775 [Melampsora larici-populina 98AG31]|uniref:Uncharacterized protein n=1 Tax=Melampsora larici-populina (strain 98AG31 / pathotype 3-4-7) TaxID=747676 RepID=F4RC82_MELLP|nr:uncharacterized protein MELLADRAFT_60775 [Melampsora larici-populina 98AG31]EGG09694.1 hypothetical protein MELLADRAFT_60775 [Melampsora larici-populina 98AG31]